MLSFIWLVRSFVHIVFKVFTLSPFLDVIFWLKYKLGAAWPWFWGEKSVYVRLQERRLEVESINKLEEM